MNEGGEFRSFFIFRPYLSSYSLYSIRFSPVYDNLTTSKAICHFGIFLNNDCRPNRVNLTRAAIPIQTFRLPEKYICQPTFANKRVSFTVRMSNNKTRIPLLTARSIRATVLIGAYGHLISSALFSASSITSRSPGALSLMPQR